MTNRLPLFSPTRAWVEPVVTDPPRGIVEGNGSSAKAAIAAAAGALSVPTHDENWRTRGKCKQINPELFLPIDTEEKQQVRELCRGCEVRIQCLGQAILRCDPEMQAGFTLHERKMVRTYGLDPESAITLLDSGRLKPKKIEKALKSGEALSRRK